LDIAVDSDDEDQEESSDDEDDDELDLSRQNQGDEKEATMESFTFEFNDMKDSYFHGIRVLLLQNFVQLNDASQLSELVVRQGSSFSCSFFRPAFTFVLFSLLF
jgi:hypothetical protein